MILMTFSTLVAALALVAGGVDIGLWIAQGHQLSLLTGIFVTVIGAAALALNLSSMYLRGKATGIRETLAIFRS